MIDWHPFDKSTKHNPYPHYAEVAKQSKAFIHSNILYILDYKTIKEILNDTTIYKSVSPIYANRNGLDSYRNIVQFFLFFIGDIKKTQKFKATRIPKLFHKRCGKNSPE